MVCVRLQGRVDFGTVPVEHSLAEVLLPISFDVLFLHCVAR